MATLDYRVLGPLEIVRDGEPVVIRARKQRAVLGLLLLRANGPVSQDELIDQLWGANAPATARASLQNQIHALRRVLGPDALERRGDGYLLHVEEGSLDLERFEQLVDAARRASPGERAVLLREALALWRGLPLVEFPTEPFAQSEIVRLEEERLSALEDRIDAELELGLNDALVPELETLVAEYPLRERLWASLMLALYRSGRQADALAAYARAHEQFVDELGVEPGVELRELQRAVLLQDPALDEPGRHLGWTLERASVFLPWHPSERAESLLAYAHALTRAGELRKAWSTYEAAIRTAQLAGDRSVEQRARLTMAHGDVWSRGASPRAFLQEVERALVEFEELGDTAGLQLALWFELFNTWTALGRAEESARIALRAAELAASLGDTTEERQCLANRVLFLAVGPANVDEALVEGRELLARFDWEDASVSPEVVIRLWSAVALLLAQRSQPDEALDFNRRAVERARESGALFLYGDALVWRAATQYISGDLDEAVTSYRAAHAAVHTEPGHAFARMTAAGFATMLALQGASEESLPLADRARAGSPDDFLTQLLWRRALALVSLRRGDLVAAVRLSEEALELANGCDWLFLRGMVWEEAALIRRRAGDRTGVETALREAFALYERKGSAAGTDRVRGALEALESL